MTNNYTIVLAAGKGSRMKSDLPKGAFPILYRPMVVYPVLNSLELGFSKIVVVVGHKKEIIEDILSSINCEFAFQSLINGTASAVLASRNILENKKGNTMIIPADMPLISKKLISDVISFHNSSKSDLTVLTSIMDNPFSYGRIVKDNKGQIVKIVEELDANESEKTIKEVNTGVLICNNELLFKELDKIDNNNSKKEYYLTDLVKVMINDGYKVSTFLSDSSNETLGVNDLYMLSEAEKILRNRINKEYMLNGVNIINPETVTIGPDVIIEKDVTIEPNTYIYGSSVIGPNSIIGPNSELKNAKIGENVWVRHSIVYDSIVSDNSVVGPFSHLRNNTFLGKDNIIGNYVELKNAKTGNNTNASHLSYIGDSVIGNNVNFGCGSITVNFDGKNKWQTTIKDNVFIGCNSNLIAPINIEEDSFIAAGSTVSNNVPKGALAIARSMQVNKENYAQILKEKAQRKANKLKEENE